MKGVRKQFSNKLHDGHDAKARDAAKRYWKAQGYLAIDNPNTKGVDLLIMDPATDEVLGYCEVEVKNNWNNRTFQYDTLQIPERKGKYLEQYGEQIRYMVFSKDLTQAFLLDKLSFKRAALKEVSNKYVRKGEYFYQVPIKDCDLIKVEE